MNPSAGDALDNLIDATRRLYRYEALHAKASVRAAVREGAHMLKDISSRLSVLFHNEAIVTIVPA